MQELIKALVKAKQEFTPITKDKRNPHFKNEYASLDAILAAVEPALHKHGLVVLQTVELADSGSILVTKLVHESGESIDSNYPLPTLTDPQKFGGAITYARRYSVCALLSVTADEDDDGNAASGVGQQRTQGAAKPKPAKQSNPNAITQKQVGLLQGELKKMNYTPAMLALFKKDCGVTSAKDIPKAKFEETLAKARAQDWADYYRQQEDATAEGWEGEEAA